MTQIILKYDPKSEHSVSDGKIESYVKQLIVVFKRDGFYQSTFSTIAVLQEFFTQIIEQGIEADLIEIIYMIGDKKVTTVIKEKD